MVTALQQAVGPDAMYQVPSARTGQVPLEMLLSRYALVAGHFTMAQIPPAVLDRVFTFTFLREPVDRVVSLYFFYKEYPDTTVTDPRAARVKSSDFAAFVDGLDDRVSPWSNWQTYVFSGASDCEAPARELLPFALANLERLSFVGVQDDLAAGFRRLSERRGWTVVGPLARLHATKHRPRNQDLPQSALSRLAELNACDRELFARARQLWAARASRSAASPGTVAAAAPSEPSGAPTASGTQEITITAVEANPADGTVVVRARSRVATDDVTVGIRITDAIGLEIYGTNTRLLGRQFAVSPGESFEVIFQMQMPLAPGTYQVTAAVHGADDHLSKSYHWIDNAATFTCEPSARFSGLIDLKATASVRPNRPPLGPGNSDA